MLAFSFSLPAQETSSHSCTADETVDFHGYLQDVPAIKELAKELEGGEQRRAQFTIPVRFTEFTDGQGVPFPITSPTNPVGVPPAYSLTNPNQGYTNDIFNNLNTIFGSGFNFYNCGTISIISDDRLGGDSPPIGYPQLSDIHHELSYSSGSAEVKWNPASNGQSATYPPPVFVEVNPYFIHPPLEFDNTVSGGTRGNYIGISHELGHHLGLLHTFGLPAPYILPVTPDYLPLPQNNQWGWPEPLNTNDYPWPFEIVNEIRSMDEPEWTHYHTEFIEANQGWRGRELAIRQSDISKDFPTPNFDVGGDLVEDTPADVNPGNVNYPNSGNPWFVQSLNGQCAFKPGLSSDYVDYNGDLVYPHSSSYLNILDNMMGYWYCDEDDNLITQGQRDRANYYYLNHRAAQYGNQSLCGAFDGKVIDEKNGLGMNMVTVRTRHAGPFAKTISNVTTNLAGEFSGRLFTDEEVMAHVWYNGTQSDYQIIGGVFEPIFVFDNQNDLASHFNYYPVGTVSDWLRDVDMLDAAAIYNHILQGGTNNNYLMNGFNIVGADVNHSNTITPTDMVEVQRLILGYTTKFAAYEQPYRFIPEFVPESDIKNFHANPFTMPLGQGSAYLNAGWSYDISSVALNKRGFIASKLGDVDGPPPPNKHISVVKVRTNYLKGMTNTNLRVGDDIELVVSTENFKNMDVFQFQLDFDAEYLKNIEISPLADLEDYTIDNNFNILAEENERISMRSVWLSDPQTLKNLEDGSSLFSIKASVVQDFDKLDDILTIGGEQGIKSWVSHEVDLGKSNPELVISLGKSAKSRNDDQALVALNTVQIFPNPFQDFVQISFEAETSHKVVIELFDVHGKLLIQKNKIASIGFNKIILDDFGQLELGVYQVKLNINGQSVTKTIFKSK